MGELGEVEINTANTKNIKPQEKPSTATPTEVSRNTSILNTESEDKEVAEHKEAVEKARKTLFEISQTDPDLLKKGKIIYGFPESVSVFDIADKYGISVEKLAETGLLKKVELQRNKFVYLRQEGFDDAYKYADIIPVSLEEARREIDFFDGKSRNLEEMTADAEQWIRSMYEKYGDTNGKEPHENDAFRVNRLVEDIFNSEIPQFLREHLKSQAVELIKRQANEGEKGQQFKEPQDYQEALRSLFLENLHKISSGGGAPMIRHWIDPTRSTPAENIMAAQVLMYPDIAQQKAEALIENGLV